MNTPITRYVRVGAGAVVGILLLLLTAYYWTTPAGQLWIHMPGYELGSVTIHVKHGIAALILAIFAFIFAWFSSAKETTGVE